MTTHKLEFGPCASCANGTFETLMDALTDVHGTTADQFGLARCHTCGLITLRPRPPRDAIAAYYPDDYQPYATTGAADVRRGRRALRGLAAAVRAISFAPSRLRYPPVERYPEPRPSRDRLLDVGTGAGDYAARMAARGWRVNGIEPSLPAASTAERVAGLPPGAIVVGSAETARLPEGAFDLVTMMHVIEHFHDPLEVLCRARQWMAPDARLLIWCPNFASIERRVFGRWWLGLDPPRHLTHFTPETLTAMLEQAGFRVVRITGEEQSMSLAASLWRAVRRGRALWPPQALHHAMAPVSGLMLTAGQRAFMAVEAVPAQRKCR